MTQYKYDQLQFSTEIPNFINLPTLSSSIQCSGTIANGATANFSTTISINPLTSFNNIRVTDVSTGKSLYLTDNNAITLLWQYVDSETVQGSVTFSGTTVTIQISVGNLSGMFSSLTMITQTFNIDVIGYQLPF